MLLFINHWINLFKHKTRTFGLAEKRSPKWHTLEKHFLESHSVCEVCGGSVNLNVHHIVPFHIDPELELDTTNLITVCMGKLECHLRIAHANNFRLTNPNIVSDAAEIRSDISKFDIIAARAKLNAK